MARMMDDSNRAQMLMQMLSQQGGEVPPQAQAAAVQPPMPTEPSQGPEQQGEQMVSVPISLVNAGMAALMKQASGGRSLGADGAGEEVEEQEQEQRGNQ